MASADDLTNDSIPVMRIYKETGTGDVPTDVRDLPFKAVCFSLRKGAVSVIFRREERS